MSRSLRPDALGTLARRLGVRVGDAPDRAPDHGDSRVTLGLDSLDRRLDGGLARRALHEVFAATGDDASAAAGFALMAAIRACAGDAPVLWVREHRCGRINGQLHAPGLADLGIDPAVLVLVEAPDTLGVLRAAADIVKCGDVGAVVIEPWGKAPLLDLTASRRLSMAAATSGVMTLVVRVDAPPMPSAAQTRWQVATAPSAALAAGAPGHPAFDLALLRHRGGIAGFETRVEWNRDTRSFAPLSGGIPAAVAVGTDLARLPHERRAA